jgi:hypothetical protein
MYMYTHRKANFFQWIFPFTTDYQNDHCVGQCIIKTTLDLLDAS